MPCLGRTEDRKWFIAAQPKSRAVPVMDHDMQAPPPALQDVLVAVATTLLTMHTLLHESTSAVVLTATG